MVVSDNDETTYIHISGIFPRLQSNSGCGRVSQVLWQESGMQLVVMGASIWALHALCQLHWSRHWSPCSWALSWLHQWRERVSGDWERGRANHFFHNHYALSQKFKMAHAFLSNVFQPQVSCKRMPRCIQVQGWFCRLLCHQHTWGMHRKVQWYGGLSMVHPWKGKRSLHSLWGVQWPVRLRDMCKWREEMCPWIQRLIIDHKYQKQLNHDHLSWFITGTTVDPPAESGGWVLNVNWTHSYYYLVRDTQMIFGEGGPGKNLLQFSLALQK